MTKAAPPFRFEQLDKHDRSTFDSGTPVLDNYLKTMASQDMRRGLANCFLAIHRESEAIAGYYTLSASNVVLHDLPKGHNFGRYTSIPAILIGRLAVDRRFQGQGLGRILLVDAMRQMSASTVAAALWWSKPKTTVRPPFTGIAVFKPMALLATNSSYPFSMSGAYFRRHDKRPCLESLDR